VPDRTVFIVDDDEAIRDSLSALLETREYSVHAYASGTAFLGAYDPSWRGSLLLDIRMPGMDGLEVQHELAARGNALAVIMMTAHGDVNLAVRAMKAGAIDFLEKPIESDALFAALHASAQAIQAVMSRSSVADAARNEERFARLTGREKEVLEHLVAGLSNKVIAHKLHISPRTVELHRARVMHKMEAASLSHLVRMALSLGINPE